MEVGPTTSQLSLFSIPRIQLFSESTSGIQWDWESHGIQPPPIKDSESFYWYQWWGFLTKNIYFYSFLFSESHGGETRFRGSLSISLSINYINKKAHSDPLRGAPEKRDKRKGDLYSFFNFPISTNTKSYLSYPSVTAKCFSAGN